MILSYILTKTWVRHFYQSHLGYFLLGMLVFFGFMRSTEHLALASFFVAAPENLISPTVFWMLYGLRAMFFLKNLHAKPEFEWLHVGSLMPLFFQIVNLLFVAVYILFPVLAYAVFLVMMAAHLGVYSSLWIVIVISLFLIASLVANMLWRLRHTSLSPTTNWLERWTNRNYNKPVSLLFLLNYVKRQGWLLMLSKAVSIVLIWIGCQAYLHEDFDWRLLGIICLFANSGSIMMMVAYHRLENHDFLMLRQQPVSSFERLMRVITINLIFVLPEVLVLLMQFPTDIHPLMTIPFAAFIVSMPLVVYGFMFDPKLWPDLYVRRIFYYILICFLLILYSVNLGILAIAQLLIAYGYIYYKFEKFEYFPEK